MAAPFRVCLLSRLSKVCRNSSLFSFSSRTDTQPCFRSINSAAPGRLIQRQLPPAPRTHESLKSGGQIASFPLISPKWASFGPASLPQGIFHTSNRGLRSSTERYRESQSSFAPHCLAGDSSEEHAWVSLQSFRLKFSSAGGALSRKIGMGAP